LNVSGVGGKVDGLSAGTADLHGPGRQHDGGLGILIVDGDDIIIAPGDQGADKRGARVGDTGNGVGALGQSERTDRNAIHKNGSHVIGVQTDIDAHGITNTLGKGVLSPSFH
jgi:hypothetical protein